MQYKISVIVPVYNGEAYIEKCFENLSKQTLKELQIIFVDDGSSDKSWELIKKCAEISERVVAIHQNNKGVSVARNTGITKASGKYLGFVDVDDVIDDDMFELLYTYAINHDLDVLGMESVGEKGELSVFEDKNTLLTMFFTQKILMSACNKIFRRSMEPTVHFPEGIRINEDLMAVYKAFCTSNRVGCINIEKYHYIRHEGSGSRPPVFDEKYFDAIIVAQKIYADSLLHYPDIEIAAEARKARTYMRITKLYYMRGMPKKYRAQILEMKEYLANLDKKHLKEYFGKYDLIRYFLYMHSFPLFLLLMKTVDRQ